MTRPLRRDILLPVNIPGARFLSIAWFVVLWLVPAGAATFQPAPGRFSEPAVLAMVGIGFFGLGLMRRRYNGD